MGAFRKDFLIFVILILLLPAASAQNLKEKTKGDIPEGYTLFRAEEGGITMYCKINGNGSGQTNYVQVVDLSSGASFKLLYGSIESNGDDPRFKRQGIDVFWADLYKSNTNAYSVFNGAFFCNLEEPDCVGSTWLQYALQVDGKLLTLGHCTCSEDKPPGCGESCPKRILEIWPDKADIVCCDESLICGSQVLLKAPNFIVANSKDADRNQSSQVGRSFIGVKDGNGDGLYEIILVFNSNKADQEEAATTLKGFGATKVIMLDGGGSTQLKVYFQKDPLIKSSDSPPRTIPQAIGIIRAPAVSSKIKGETTKQK